jgi:TRAP-type C4-dicarboxylate transport system permease large subunit
MPPSKRAGYRREDAASLIAAGTAMGMPVPPASFAIVIIAATNQSAAALFLAGFIPAATIGGILCVPVMILARILGRPRRLARASRDAGPRRPFARTPRLLRLARDDGGAGAVNGFATNP